MLYQVELLTPSTTERCFEVTRTFTVGTLRAAELAAEGMLSPAYETTHSARYARLPFVLVYRVPELVAYATGMAADRRHPRPVSTHETLVVYVPSCGDLGWCP